MKPDYIAYSIVNLNSDKTKWVEIGVGFINKDQSINLRLNALPTDGELQLRVPKPAASNK